MAGEILYEKAKFTPTPLPGGIEGATLEGASLNLFNGQPEVRLAFEEGFVIVLFPRGTVVDSLSITGGTGKVLRAVLVRSAGLPGFTLRIVTSRGELEVACRVPGGDLEEDPEVGFWFVE